MKEISGALIAISLALVAVFVPVAFFPGTTGQLYKQFALTITFSIALSTFNALTFTPALSAVLLRLEDHDKKFKFLKWFDHNVDEIRDRFKSSLQSILNIKPLVISVFLALLVVTGILFNLVPKGFVPNEDQSWFIILVQGPDGTSLNHTNAVLNEIDELLNKQEEVLGSFAVTGYSFTGNAPNKATVFVTMKPLEERKRGDQSTKGTIEKMRGPLMGIPGAIIFPIEPPAISGLGQFGGFEFQLKDEAGDSPERLANTAYAIMGEANQKPELSGLFSTYTVSDPQIKLDVDRQKAQALGVSISEIYTTLQIYLGSIYVNDFDFLNRIYRVYVQADESYRSTPEDINRFYVRSQAGNMVPLANLVSLQKIFNPQNISHYNLARATMIQGNTKPGISQEQGMQAMEKVADKVLAEGMSYEWTGIALEQMESGTQTALFFMLGLVFVFLVLAAQYENFVDPLIILLSVPLAVLGALLSIIIRGWLDPGFYFGLMQTFGFLQQTGNPMIILGLFLQFFQGGQNDVFCQVGLVMLIGLASKNSILIVEFANQLREQGQSLTDAAIEAAKTRFRPIVMTSLAFIVGVFPLVIATGAGSAARNSMGTAVFGGMIVSTFLSLFIVPVIYVVVHQLVDKLKKDKSPSPE
jgi:HAE1 family hydrophobic/amphiphilic exporter-1